MPWDPTTFGNNLRRQRAVCNMTQEELGKRVGVGPSTVAWLECGKKNPSIGVFVALAEVLGVSPEELMGWKPKHKPPKASL